MLKMATFINVRSLVSQNVTIEKSRKRLHFNRTARKSPFFSALAVSSYLLTAALAMPAGAQSADTDASAVAASASTTNLIRWTGSLPQAAGRTVETVFAIYQNPAGGSALWSETQPVKVGTDGRYTVLLGAASAEGISQTLFQAGEARWIEARPVQEDWKATSSGEALDEAANMALPTRSLLAAVPYALKSIDSETLAGREASDYVTREDLQSTLANQVQAMSSIKNSMSNVANPLPIVGTPMPIQGSPLPSSSGGSTALNGAGTSGFLPAWTASATLGNSMIAESGTNVGIGTSAPATMLDVNGASTLRGTVSLLATAATLAAGVNSPALQLGASAFSSSSNAAVPQNFVWQAQSTGNNTASPTANLSLLFGAGSSTPVATGLSIAPNGQITFAPGQTFPSTGASGTSSAITAVTAGSGLTGGGSSGNVTIALSGPISTANGGTGATTPAAALASLGAMPLSGGTMIGPLNGTSASFSSTVTAGAELLTGNFALGNRSLDFMCSGTAADASNIQSAISSLYSSGSTLRLHGSCLLSGLGTQLILISAYNSLHIDCGSWYGTVLSVAASVPATTDVIRVTGNSIGVTIENCDIQAQSSNAKSVIDLDATNNAVEMFKLNHDWINTNGKAIITTVPDGTVNGVFDSVIENNLISGGIYLYNGGDQINITKNILYGSGIGVYARLVPGAMGPNVYHNTIVSCGGAVVIDAARSPEILYNEIEPHGACGPEVNGASIDIVGTSALPVLSPIVEGNTGSIGPSFGSYLVRIDHALDAKIDKNNCYSQVKGQVCIILTPNPIGTILGANTSISVGGPGILIANSEADLTQEAIIPYSPTATTSVKTSTANAYNPTAILATHTSTPNTFGCLDGFDHLPCTVARIAPTLLSGATEITTSLLTPTTSGSYQMCGYIELVQATVAGTAIYLTPSYISDGHIQNGINMTTLNTTETPWSVASGCVQFYSDVSHPIGVSLHYSSIFGKPTIRYWVILERLQ
jgi:hypothetical protein